MSNLIKFRPMAASRFFPETFFNDFFNEAWNRSLTNTTLPAVNIAEDPDAYRIELAAPGFDKDDFKVELEADQLRISAEKKTESNEENDRYTRREFSYSSFERRFNLPKSVNQENMKAAYQNGILTLTLPKVDEAKKLVKTIAVG